MITAALCEPSGSCQKVSRSRPPVLIGICDIAGAPVAAILRSLYFSTIAPTSQSAFATSAASVLTIVGRIPRGVDKQIGHAVFLRHSASRAAVDWVTEPDLPHSSPTLFGERKQSVVTLLQVKPFASG